MRYGLRCSVYQVSEKVKTSAWLGVQVDRLYKLRVQANSLVFIYVKSLWK
jgi:Na+-transporting NADH:ubiquinone oxidoreductase subunit NqrE